MRSLTLVFVLFGVSLFGGLTEPACAQVKSTSESDQVLRRAFEEHTSNLQVEGRGVVRRILSDDNEGSRHQRFILELSSGQTLLMSHNIDLAPRIPGLRKGDKVSFRGEYDWNREGGVIHWTHHDPDGRRPGGWLKHKGTTYR
jgi:Protein of unknown function (DUF3465)